LSAPYFAGAGQTVKGMLDTGKYTFFGFIAENESWQE
jgi:hypothetical protein